MANYTRLIASTAFAAMAACASHQTPASAPVPVQGGTGQLVFRGVVQDLERYVRLDQATVELALVGDVAHPLAVAATDEKGEFAFSGISPGVYMLHIGRPGYNEQRMRVEASATDDKPVDIRLRSLRTRCIASRYHTDCP